MDKNFEEIFSNVILKEVAKLLTGANGMGIDLEESYQTSVDVISFDSTNEALINNPDFVRAFGIARVKAREVLILIQALLILKRKYNISDLDFALAIEEFDEENLFGNS